MTRLLFAVLMATLAVACSKSSSDEAPAKQPASADTVNTVLAEYEAIRALLANDTGAGIADHARKIEQIAANAQPPLRAVATGAKQLATVDAGDLAALRLAFGDVSRAVVALVDADPALAARVHVFECPMAKGYKRWVQPNPGLENPYMGQSMLTCGAEVTAQK